MINIIYDRTANKFSLLSKSNKVSDLSYEDWVASSSSFSSRSLGAGEDAALPPTPVPVSGRLSSDAGTSTQRGSDRQSISTEKGVKKKLPKTIPSSTKCSSSKIPWVANIRVLRLSFLNLILT